jgi:hypothetical protein
MEMWLFPDTQRPGWSKKITQSSMEQSPSSEKRVISLVIKFPAFYITIM